MKTSLARTGFLAAALALTVSGCGFLLGPQPGGEQMDSCKWLATQDGVRTPSAADVVVLIDRSASVQTRADRYAPHWYAQIFGEENVTAEDGVLVFRNRRLPTPATVHVGAFDGDGRVDWQEPVSLPRLDGGVRFATRFVKHTERCLRKRVARAALSASRADGTDVLGAMTAGARAVSPDAESREMVVATDGLVTVGCADLSRTAMRDRRLIDRITRSCAQQRGLPALAGWKVTMSGIGSPGGGWPAPRTGQLGWLTTLWSSLCASATGDPNACRVDTRPPRASRRAADRGAADPALQFPRDETTVNPIITSDFPDRVLFATGSHELSREGLELIERFVSELAGTPEWVEVLGHTDSRGGEQDNQALSQRRAEAVAKVLREAGLTEVRARGLGESRPACEERGLTGAALAAAQSCNRRVQIRYKVRG